MQRREFNQHLQRSAIAMALAPWLSAVAAPADRPRHWQTNPFALGVASGRPRAASVVLWTRLLFSEEDRTTGTEALRVKVEVFADAALKHRVQKVEVVTDETRGHSVHVHLQQLQPSTHYWYRFTQGNATSDVGHTRTAPALNADVQKLRIALTSCQHYEQGQYVAHAEIAKQQLDFVLFLGDYIYESSNPQYAIRKHNGDEPKTLSQYRERYEQYKRAPPLHSSPSSPPFFLLFSAPSFFNSSSP